MFSKPANDTEAFKEQLINSSEVKKKTNNQTVRP